MAVQKISDLNQRSAVARKASMSRAAVVSKLASKAKKRKAAIARMDGIANRLVAAFKDPARKFTRAQLGTVATTLAAMQRHVAVARQSALRHIHTAIRTDVATKLLNAQVEDLSILASKVAVLSTVVSASLKSAEGDDLLQIDENGYVVDDGLKPVDDLPEGATNQAEEDENFLEDTDPSLDAPLEDPLTFVPDGQTADLNSDLQEQNLLQDTQDPALLGQQTATDTPATTDPVVVEENEQLPVGTPVAKTATQLQPEDELNRQVEPMNDGVAAPANAEPAPNNGEVVTAAEDEPAANPAAEVVEDEPAADPAAQEPDTLDGDTAAEGEGEVLDLTVDDLVDDDEVDTDLDSNPAAASDEDEEVLDLEIPDLGIDDILNAEILDDGDFSEDEPAAPVTASSSVRTARRSTAATRGRTAADQTTEADVFRALVMD